MRKKDGSLRYTVDFRDLNKNTVKQATPLPLIEECLDTLEGNTFMSGLDLTSGYFQIELDEADRHKTAFSTRYGLYEHVRMAQGLTGSPSTFQRAMNLVLRGLTFETVLCFLDDVLVLGKNFDDHLENLKEVWQRMINYNLKLKPRKCTLFATEIEFLGRTVTADGIGIQEAKVEKVKNWPTPRSVKDVQAFLGMANYHREHIKGFSHTAEPLSRLTGKKCKFEWAEEQEDAFATLREKLTTAPILALPNRNDPFILDTDASDKAIGASLSQVQDGVERVIAYASMSLDETRRRYCTTRKELLAVVMFTRHFRHYLLGREFLVRTDHASLLWLTRFRDIEGQLSRWLTELGQYSMVLQHRPGCKHCNADALSRMDSSQCCECYELGRGPESLPCFNEETAKACDYCLKQQTAWRRFEEEIDDVVPLVSGSIGVRSVKMGKACENEEYIPRWSNGELVKLQHEDPDIEPIIHWLGPWQEEGVMPQEADVRIASRATKNLWAKREYLSLKEGALYKSQALDGV